MTFLYNTTIFCYSLLIRVFAVFNKKAELFISGRKGWEKKLNEKIDSQGKYIWFHCASLGEFEQGRPVIEELKKQYPEGKIILTFFSPSGYEVRKNYALADVILYLPLDTKRNAQTFLKIVKPKIAFFIKYEFWYHFINELKNQQIPLYAVSAIFRENQQFFKKSLWGKWYRKMLFQFEHFFVQNETSAQLLKNVGISNVTISGDTRFDRVAAIAKDSKLIPVVEKFKDELPLIVAGSTWKPDEELLVAFINQSSNVKFIIAPHEVSAANINRLQQLLKKPAVLFSNINESEIDKFDVLIINSIGILSSVYRYGNLAYIGGGFGVGIHNILEAATFGLPIIFGPNYKKFKEAVDLVREGGAFPIQNYGDLLLSIDNLLGSENVLQKASGICKNYVSKNVGSTIVIINKVFNTSSFLD